MDEHPENCPGCAECFYDDSVEVDEQRHLEAQQLEEDLAEQFAAAIGLAIAR